jgi:hypothetical protein
VYIGTSDFMAFNPSKYVEIESFLSPVSGFNEKVLIRPDLDP